MPTLIILYRAFFEKRKYDNAIHPSDTLFHMCFVCLNFRMAHFQGTSLGRIGLKESAKSSFKSRLLISQDPLCRSRKCQAFREYTNGNSTEEARY